MAREFNTVQDNTPSVCRLKSSVSMQGFVTIVTVINLLTSTLFVKGVPNCHDQESELNNTVTKQYSFNNL